MTTTQSNPLSGTIQQIYEQFSEVLRLQAEHLEQLHQSINLLQDEQRRLEEAAARLLEPLERYLAGSAGTKAPPPAALLGCMRNLAAATYAGQVFELLAEEMAQMGVRAAVFDVRGRAAWGFAAGGFGPELSLEALRTLVVPLNSDGPFRQAVDSARAVETNSAGLEKLHNVLARLTPAANGRIMLIPVKSAGCVAAVLHAETPEKRDPALIDTLQVLADFAGAQMDRLMALHGQVEIVETAPATEIAGEASEEEAAVEARPAEPQTAAAAEVAALPSEVPTAEAAPVAQEPAAVETVPAEPARPEEEQASAVSVEGAQTAEEPPATEQAAETAPPTEDEEKVHRDARRFSKLLVSEIELYNKESVDEGRRSKDLYQRLKKDIDRSRETYEKRFAHTVANRVDYFHEELVRTLAENDPSLLGSGYPGPSV